MASSRFITSSKSLPPATEGREDVVSEGRWFGLRTTTSGPLWLWERRISPSVEGCSNDWRIDGCGMERGGDADCDGFEEGGDATGDRSEGCGMGVVGWSWESEGLLAAGCERRGGEAAAGVREATGV